MQNSLIVFKMLLRGSIDLTDKSFDCDLCRKYGYYKERNCDGQEQPKPNIIDRTVRFNIDDNVVLEYCPKILLYDDEVMELINLFVFFEKGHLLVNGGVEDQPYYYYKAMLLFTDEKNKFEQEQLGGK